MYLLREYSMPLLCALALHALAVAALYRGWTPEKETLNIIQPRTVMANLIVLEPKAPKAKAPPKPVQRAAPPKAAPKKVEPKKVTQPDPELARKKKAEAEAAKRAAEQAAREQQRQERLARLSELAQTSLDRAISDESASLQEGNEEMVAQSFRLGIYDLVRQNWSRPPSARNGMQAKLLVELIPTGEVVAVSVVESSGNSAFDRSAEQAVRRARRFEVPAQNSIFEDHFRQFYFLFQPEDLLR